MRFSRHNFRVQSFSAVAGNFQKRSHFNTQWKIRARTSGNNKILFSFRSPCHLTRARVFHGPEIVYCFLLLLLALLTLFCCMFSKHFPTRAFSICPTSQSGAATALLVVSSCYFTFRCGRSTQLFFRLLRLFYNYNRRDGKRQSEQNG